MDFFSADVEIVVGWLVPDSERHRIWQAAQKNIEGGDS